MSALYGVNLRLLAAFRHLMVPLVRILLRAGIPFREFSEVVREIYVHVAADEFAKPNRPASLARLAIVTGLTRRQITDIFEEEDRLKRALESNAKALARLLQGWHNDPDFMGPYGFPRDLFFDADPSGAGSFSDLVRRYAADLPPGIMLDELIRVKAAAQVVESGMIRVFKRTYIPEEMVPELIEVFARGVRRYVETIDHNIREKDPRSRRFERWVFPDFGIREEDWGPFRALVHERLQDVIEDLDRRFSGFEKPQAGRDETLSVGVGMYLYKDDEDDERLFRKEPNKFGTGS
jgi:hypothetical protein